MNGLDQARHPLAWIAAAFLDAMNRISRPPLRTRFF
jgi:hypothetical protein